MKNFNYEKKHIFLLLLTIIFFKIQAQSTYYYYYNKQIPLDTYAGKQFILVEHANDTAFVKLNLTKKGFAVEEFQKTSTHIAFTGKTTAKEQYYTNVYNKNSTTSLSSIEKINYASPSFITEKNDTITSSHLFYVKLSRCSDTSVLKNLSEVHHVEIIGNDKYMPLWYTLSCSKASTGNAVEMANLFHQSGNFITAEPDLIINNCLLTNDTEFPDQWGLHQTSGLDIGYNEASQITSGNSDIIVAIIDYGVQFEHEDLNHHSFNISHNTSTGSPIDPLSIIENHGTYCAGIIGATTNNNLGIAGIAPSCPIMSIAVDFDNNVGIVQKIAYAINYASDNDASVINLAWERNNIESIMIDDAINNALTEGRSGKGCVIVAGSGNSGDTLVTYPSRLDGVISVGGIDNEGKRNIDSNYGSKLSIVAPGSHILTTETLRPTGCIAPYGSPTYNFYPIYFHHYVPISGTSASCPHVTAVAALMLSVNPNLTTFEVKKIIEQTAKKIRTDLYTYQQDSNFSNETFNFEVGYGLIDAHSAITEAIATQEADLFIKDSISDDGIVPSSAQAMWNSPDIWIEDMNGNTIDNPHGNLEYKVCIRVYNRNNVITTGTQKLFVNWAKAGVDLRWPHHWNGENYYNCNGTAVPKGGSIGNSNGIHIGEIEPNSSKVIKVTWSVPRAEDYAQCGHFNSELWHFCLLARIHDDEEILHEEEENCNMATFVTHNNNVAWKNMSVLNSQYSKAGISISNPHSTPQAFTIKYNAYPNDKNEKLNQFAEVYLTFCDELANQWQGNGTGFKRVTENQILILSNEVILTGVVMQPNSLYTIETAVGFLTQSTPQNNEFHFDIALYDNDMKLIGGEHYVAAKDNERDFKAIALDDVTLLSSQSATFTATSINEEATYTWFSQSGDTVAVGQTLRTTPQITQSYTLEVVADADGAKDYDEVTATVQGGLITQISPNPASEQVNIYYQLAPNIPQAKLQIVNTIGMIVKKQTVNNQNNNTSISTQNLIVGQYTVQLTSQSGGILDSKILIIQ